MSDEKVQELLDKESIKELRFKIAQSLDFKDWALFESLLTEQVHADFSAIGLGDQTVSKDDFVGSFKHNLSREGLKTQHIYSNFRIVIDGDKATAKFNQLSQHYIAGFEGGEEFFLRGEYTDTLVRTPDGWKLTGVSFIPFYTTGNAKILAG